MNREVGQLSDGSTPKPVAIVEPVGGHGGMNYYDFGLARGLAAAGQPVRLYTCEATREGDEPGIRVMKLFQGVYGSANRWKRGLRFIGGLRSTARDARQAGVRVVHLHFFQASIEELLSLIWLKFAGFSIVITVHDVESFARRRSPVFFRLAARLVSHFIVHNRFSLEQLSRRLGAQTLRGRSSVIPHGNFLPWIQDVDPLEARRKLCLPEGPPLILFFGQIKKVKGLDLLLRAFAHYRQTGGEGRLVIAGRPWKDDFADYRALIEELDLAESVHLFIHYIPDQQIPLFFNAADLVILPYYRIYQSAVVLQAMSYGKAVLTSDLPSMRELITDGYDGLLFRSGDQADLARQIHKCLATTGLLQTVEQEARNTVKKEHCWNAIGRTTRDVYKAINLQKYSQ